MANYSKIGIIAGNGGLPGSLVEGCLSVGCDVHLVVLDSVDPVPEYAASVNHVVLNISSVGKAISFFKKAGVKYVVFAGSIKRPDMLSLRPDIEGVKLLATLVRSKFKGDNSMLASVVSFFERKGFSIIGADEVLKDLLMSFGPVGKLRPSDVLLEDIDFGVEVARMIGGLDIGQGVVVQQGVILGVEALEGTDALIERCSKLKQKGEKPVLVKMRKPNQDSRIDLPAIGVATIENISAAGFAGVAIEARATIIINREKVARRANELGVFVVGI